MKSFQNLDKIECKKTSNAAMQNAKEHIDTAEVLRARNRYGQAITHLITGNEEQVKSLILHLDSVGFQFRKIKGLNNVFKNHDLRYVISFLMFSLSILAEHINSLGEKLRRNEIQFERITDIENETKNDPEASQEIIERVIYELSKILDEIKFFKSFEEQRQEGMYVDYIQEIKTPSQINYSQYLELKKRIDNVQKVIHDLKISLSHDNQQSSDFLNKTLEYFHDKQVYNYIEGFLKKVNSPKINALDYIFNSITGIIRDLRD